MKVLVMSDSHGDKNLVNKIICENLDARLIIHLGDGERDMEYAQFLNDDAKIVSVCGNCDMASLLPVDCTLSVGGLAFYCTHGHNAQVKSGTSQLLKIAKKHNADIVLYGHTHIPVNSIENGVHLFNPGSVKSGVYGLIDVDDNKANFKHIFL